MSTTTPKGYRPERFLAWRRWMRIYRRTYVSAFAPVRHRRASSADTADAPKLGNVTNG